MPYCTSAYAGALAASRSIILSKLAAECGAQSKDLAELLEGQGYNVHLLQQESRRRRFGSIVAFASLAALLKEVCRPQTHR